MSALCFVAASELATTYSWESYCVRPPPEISFKSCKSHDVTYELRESFQQMSIGRLIGQEWKLGDQLEDIAPSQESWRIFRHHVSDGS